MPQVKTNGMNDLPCPSSIPPCAIFRLSLLQALYSERYENIAVMFAQIPNYKEFYEETDVNKQGLECIRFLNEIICDFDKARDSIELRGVRKAPKETSNMPICLFDAFQLLSKPKFSVLEKIKTIGSTYMVAAGLQPGREGERAVSE